ncbi:Hypothetical predicted protein, partial [Pelobates cultripes]
LPVSIPVGTLQDPSMPASRVKSLPDDARDPQETGRMHTMEHNEAISIPYKMETEFAELDTSDEALFGAKR